MSCSSTRGLLFLDHSGRDHGSESRGDRWDVTRNPIPRSSSRTYYLGYPGPELTMMETLRTASWSCKFGEQRHHHDVLGAT